MVEDEFQNLPLVGVVDREIGGLTQFRKGYGRPGLRGLHEPSIDDGVDHWQCSPLMSATRRSAYPHVRRRCKIDRPPVRCRLANVSVSRRRVNSKARKTAKR